MFMVYPDNMDNIKHCIILLEDRDDVRTWNHTTSGVLTLKLANEFFNGNSNSILWRKLLWNSYIPSSKSMILWRLIHKIIPIEENPHIRGFQFSSKCSLCLLHC